MGGSLVPTRAFRHLDFVRQDVMGYGSTSELMVFVTKKRQCRCTGDSRLTRTTEVVATMLRLAASIG